MDQTTYERLSDAFLRELLEEEYRAKAGLKDRLEITPIYEQYGALFQLEEVRQRLAERNTDVGCHLAEFAATGFLASQTSTLTEQIANSELAASIPLDGQEVSFQDAPLLIMNEPDRRRRNEFARRYYAKIAEFSPLRTRRWNLLHRLASLLGFADYVSLYDELRGLDLHRLSQSVTWLLDVTETTFRRQLGTYLGAGGISSEDADIWDIAALLRSRELDGLFAVDAMLPALKQTLSGLGIALDAQKGFCLDIEPRPRKSAFPFCQFVAPPDDVRLVVKPIGGLYDYAVLFHEAGRAQVGVQIDPALPSVHHRLGDASVGLVYAFLFEHLLLNPAWLRSIMGLASEQAQEVLRKQRFGQLFLARRRSAKLNYELEFHAGLVDAKAGAYVHWLQRGCGVQVPPQWYLTDVDEGFTVAQSLRAQILEAQLRRFLENNYGLEWFASREAGRSLKELWRKGQQYRIEELASQIGASGLNLDPLREELTAD